MSEPMLWVICGAGRGVGKTHLAQRLCAVLPKSVYAKQGWGERRVNGPANFFDSDQELEAFLERCRPTHEHIVVESNRLARAGRGDVVVYIDEVSGQTDVRDDVELLSSRSDVQVSANASIRGWRRVLRAKLPESSLREAVCDCLIEQKRHLAKGSPEVRVKIWFVQNGMHIFGAGLARLLEQVERHGTLREAAKVAHMSYRYAWGLVKNAEKHYGRPLVIFQPGGAGGGTATLSMEGRYLLNAYRRFNEKVDALAAECFSENEEEPSDRE